MSSADALRVLSFEKSAADAPREKLLIPGERTYLQTRAEGATTILHRSLFIVHQKKRRRSIHIADGDYAVGSIILRETSCFLFAMIYIINVWFYVPERSRSVLLI